MDSTENELEVLEADTVYLLMKHGFPISRNIRAQWVLQHLDTLISVQNPEYESEDTPELEIVSVLPVESDHLWSPENNWQYLYRVTSTTKIKFLSYRYRMVLSLDLSPSLATIDIENGEIVIDEIYSATQKCLEGITRPFLIPGSKRMLHPEIYVTVIVHTPFFTNPAQQVLVQGWLVTTENVGRLMQVIESELKLLEEKVAQVTGLVNLQLETVRLESEKLVGGLFEESSTNIGKNNANNIGTNLGMVSPETGFVNMLRYGMLALSLLPEYSCAQLVIISDGIVGINDVHALDSVIQQLRATTIACSFFHVGSSYHPHTANGLVPYPDLLRFLATATLGTYMTVFPALPEEGNLEMNKYHKNLLCWQLYRHEPFEVRGNDVNIWKTKNNYFYGHEPPQLLRKKQIDDQVTCTLNSMLCCRLREGYLIRRANMRDGSLEICFVLPWKTQVFIEYVVTCPRFLKTLSICNTLQYTITIEAPYEFLHDITCLSKKPLKSQYRQNMVSRFWTALTSLTDSDNMLAHFSWFPGMGRTWYNVPDTIKSGMPLFYMTSSLPSSIQLSDAACPQFGQMWQPVISLEPTQWSRWMHSQRVTLVLLHDRPLPKHLHQANQSGRFQCVQYRQAAASLYGMLKTWATFILVENHTYVHFIYREVEKPPISFCLINVSCKSLCVVLNVAFAAGTEGIVRHNIMADLLDRLSQLSLPSRRTEQSQVPCCKILHKPLEKILIRYERMPLNLNTVMFPDGSQIMAKNGAISPASFTTSLSRYLYHTRWLWLLKKPTLVTQPVSALPKPSIAAIARILSTITKIRLAEGFNFSYSAAGIINTVMEVQMKGSGSNVDGSAEANSYPCLVQYVLFPPHVVVNPVIEKDSCTTDEDTTDEGTADGENGYEDGEANGDFQIVMEVWIEPQFGYVQANDQQKKAAYMRSLEYFQLPEAISNIDKEVINALLTLEHLCLMCQTMSSEDEIVHSTMNQNQQQPQQIHPLSAIGNMSSLTVGNKTSKRPTFAQIADNPLADDRVRSMHFEFDALAVLPKCQQAELLFSMFTDDYQDQLRMDSNANRLLMGSLLSHIKSLHNKELILNAAESDRFTRMLAARPREEGYKYLFCNYDTDDSHVTKTVTSTYPRWRCFVKGISTTHVIVTLVPAAEADVQQLISQPEDESERQNATTPQAVAQGLADSMSDCRQHYVSDGTGGRSETTSPIPRFPIETVENPDLDYFKNALAFSTPKTTSIDVYNEHHATPVISPCNILGLGGETQRRTSLVLPIYVYDCSLALLVDSLVEKLEKPRFRDVRHDYTFRMADQVHQFREEFVGLKSGDNTKPSSPEPKSEDSDNITGDQQNLLEHCKIISLAHCNAYVVSVYKSLIEQQPINYSDMEAAVEQCEECLIEINITDYLRAVCRHLGNEALPPSPLNDTDEDGYGCNDTCKDMRNLHMLIKDKFRKIINVAFKQVSVHPDFYFCLPYGKNDKIAESKNMVSSDSDDEVRFSYTNETLNGKMFGSLKKVVSHTGNMTRSSAGINHDRQKLSGSPESVESYESGQNDDEQPLFIQLNCSIHSKTSFSSTAVKLLPTCFTEITQKLEDYNLKDTSSLKVTLDIICLNLPKEVLEVSIENVPSGLRTTSYCSEGSRGGDTSTDGSFDRSSLNRQHGSMHHQMSFETGDPIHENITNLPSHQYTAVTSLVDEINWLLRDETAAVLLDQPDLPSKANLEFIARHVGESRNRSSCYTDKVPLHFVFSVENSLPRFIEELKTLKVDSYSVEKEDEIFYFVKNEKEKSSTLDTDSPTPVTVRDEEESKGTMPDDSVFNTEDITQTSVVTSNIVNNNVNSSQIKKQDSGELPGYHSEISSIGDNGQLGTDDGYEGDSSDTEDECQWLVDLDRRRPRLPNFWLILRVSDDHVNVYFHCRFLELSSPEVDRYQQVHKNAVSQIKAICRRVNQYLLLRDLYDKRICDPLLENESAEDNNWKNDSSHDSTPASQTHAHASLTSGSHMTPGMFRCPIVWEVPFCLHHRLKTGPGKTGMSRGIKVLQAVLNRFSVNNRSNMFVYQERNKNVFYLRLHERTGDEKSLQSGKLSESDEKIVVSRSSSITSLSQTRIMAQSTDHVSGSSINSELLRPRVRSFGERESDIMNKSGDSIVLMVHGISEAGPEVRYDLVQVLQNRLDDAVLDVLAVMLARNPMCKLTPSDVRFIQRQYRPPECCIRFSVQEPCLSHMAALGFYLRQNILQFVYTPKYTDTRPSSHFQDYSQPETSSKHVPETDIFLYNQSQSSGSRGIACIAIAIVNENGDIVPADKEHAFHPMTMECPKIIDFENVVQTTVYPNQNCGSNEVSSSPYVEFRVWKQGRVNLEALILKLKSAVKHAHWDLITEYNFLPRPLAVPIESDEVPAKENSFDDNPMKLTPYELGEKGRLEKIYHLNLVYWLQFGLEIAVPTVRRHAVYLEHRHYLPIMLRELQNLVQSHAVDTTARAFGRFQRQPFIDGKEDLIDEIMLDKCLETGINWTKLAEIENSVENVVFLPCNPTKDEQETYTKGLLIARNFSQWKASSSSQVWSEQLIPKVADQKLLQQFNPLIRKKMFIPRQRLLLAKVQSKHIIIYMYNWSRERSEKLTRQISSLARWLSSRSILHSSLQMQKLGIFHHQSLHHFNDQRSDDRSNSFQHIADMESLAKFPTQENSDNKEWPRPASRVQVPKQSPGLGLTSIQMMDQVMRDAKPSGQYPTNTIDPVVKSAYDFQELRQKDKKIKDDLDKLYAIWQSRNVLTSLPISQSMLNSFKQHSRLIHHCHTPLLFLPMWRLKSAATRDHTLAPPLHQLVQPERSRTASNASSKKQDSTAVIEWHRTICQCMLAEYKQYLQQLGFNPIKIEASGKNKEQDDQFLKEAVYLKKSMLGGVLLFEIHLSEPFFVVKIRVIECSRLQRNKAPMANQFIQSFIDTCDKIKISMHLHSFTYDFHLRCIHSYIANSSSGVLKHGYHLTHFLEDFNKYYTKAPNFARNLMCSSAVTVRDLEIPAHTLYQYLLSHENTYGMQVIAMLDDEDDLTCTYVRNQGGDSSSSEQHNTEYVLVRLQSTPLVSYHDGTQDTRYINDFDVALVVTWADQFLPHDEDCREMTLKFYLMLTSKREMYPKRDAENSGIGKFRTVYSVMKSMAGSSQLDSPSESSPASITSPYFNKRARIEGTSLSRELPVGSVRSALLDNAESLSSLKEHVDAESLDPESSTIDVMSDPTTSMAPTPPPVPNSPLTAANVVPSSSSSTGNLSQIRQESINYLGYYSSHEQLMQQLIIAQAKIAREHIETMIEQGARHCRTHLLWNRLLESRSTMTYAEFTELRKLANIESLSSLDPRLNPLVNQPIGWYQTLAKLLQSRYQEHHKQFNAPDGNITHHLILHPNYVQAFMMLTIDLHTCRGELSAVYRKSEEITSTPFTISDIHSLVEDFVNTCCFHLWVGLNS
ncbi:KICSTOR complex protein SZT2-like isoform X1 [Trichogramma pretiosum]|uniref:KICSTOR complex protein SZT2-like isoform X1 n=1 Tax=Trichogramma pretiosum TaxID=7493 RepID=UPI0006C96D40|nr:KICSTOR complex protein SZT2-like isoform X1 [Trichogramma pretiosum]